MSTPTDSDREAARERAKEIAAQVHASWPDRDPAVVAAELAITDCLAAARPTWTGTPPDTETFDPKRPWWWFLYDPERPETATVVKVDRGAYFLEIQVYGRWRSIGSITEEYPNALWCGPIPTPAEPTV